MLFLGALLAAGVTILALLLLALATFGTFEPDFEVLAAMLAGGHCLFLIAPGGFLCWLLMREDSGITTWRRFRQGALLGSTAATILALGNYFFVIPEYAMDPTASPIPTMTGLFGLAAFQLPLFFRWRGWAAISSRWLQVLGLMTGAVLAGSLAIVLWMKTEQELVRNGEVVSWMQANPDMVSSDGVAWMWAATHALFAARQGLLALTAAVIPLLWLVRGATEAPQWLGMVQGVALAFPAACALGVANRHSVVITESWVADSPKAMAYGLLGLIVLLIPVVFRWQGWRHFPSRQ